MSEMMRPELTGEPFEPGVPRVRNRYFTGKLMTARDLLAEQEYFLGRHRMQNRLALGWGIVCGLEVTDGGAECPGWLRVSPGMAIDCYGRELILEKAATIEFKAETGAAGAAAGPPPSPGAPEANAPAAEPAASENTGQAAPAPPRVGPPPGAMLLYLRYDERFIEPVAVLDPRIGCHADDQECSRVCEVPELKLVPWGDVPRGCWPVRETPTRPTPEEAEAAECDTRPCDHRSCLPPCPCGEWVPLALVWRDADGRVKIDDSGRHYVHPCRRPVTTIIDTNWVHGETTNRVELNSRVNLPDDHNPDSLYLKIRFSRKLKPRADDEEGLGPYFHTLFVEKYDTNMVRDEQRPEAVKLVDGDTALLIEMGEHECQALENDWTRLTLQCDFLEDCHGTPIDGNFLRGKFPTGNGTPGGDFVSWFKLVRPTAPARGGRRR